MRIVYLLPFLFIFSCVHDPLVPPIENPDPNAPCDSTLIHFQEEVLPIFLTHCAQSACHGGNNPQKGIRLDNYANIRNTAGLDFNRPERSKIMKDGILEEDRDKQMPPLPNPLLNAQQITTILNWIRQGAKDTSCSNKACDTLQVTHTNQVNGIMNTYCVGCHNAQLASGNVQLHTYAAVRQTGLSGRLLGAIEHRSGFVAMPQGGNKLPACELRSIQIWVENGMPQ
jgi:Zn ribbon nucleic-acid-binding protein